LGCVFMWKQLIEMSPDQFSSRTVKTISELEKAVSTFSSELNPQNEELLEVMERIRSKFKQASSLLGFKIKLEEGLNF